LIKAELILMGPIWA